MDKWIISISCLFALFTGLQAQVDERGYEQIQGHPFIQNYSPEDYQAFSQNWQALQDERGLIHIANNFGLLTFDGVSWKLHKTPQAKQIRTLSLDKAQRIWVGGRKAFGYFASDSVGSLSYTSIMDLLPEAFRAFDLVYTILQTSHGVYICTDNYLFRWKEKAGSKKGQLEVLAKDQDASLGYVVEDDLYVRVKGKGLTRLVGDSLQVVGQGSFFADKRIHSMLPLPSQNEKGQSHILIGCSTQGLFIFDGNAVQAFPLEAEAATYFQSFPIFAGHLLRNGNMAFACISGGMAILSPEGKLLDVINQASGMRDALVLNLLEDAQGGIWLTLSDGLAHIELNSPFRFFSEKDGLNMNVDDIVWHQGKLFISGEKGVYSLAPSLSMDKPSFQKLPTYDGINWKIISNGSSLIAGSTVGIFEIDPDALQLHKFSDIPVFSLCFSALYPGCLFVGRSDGISVFTIQQENWRHCGNIPGLHEIISFLTEDASATLWAGIPLGFARISLEAESLHEALSGNLDGVRTIAAEILVFDQDAAQGSVFPGSKGPILANRYGLHRFEKASRQWVPDTSISPRFGDRKWQVLTAFEDSRHRIWMDCYDGEYKELGVYSPNAQGGFQQETTPFFRLKEFGEVWAMYAHPERPDIMWFGTNHELIRYDHTAILSYKPLFPPLIRKVLANKSEVVFGGGYLFEKKPPTLSYAQNALRFEYALPAFDLHEKTEYQFKLEGFDSEWSGWDTESRQDYTNLPEGDYRFMVRGKNIYGEISEAGIWAFSIEAPWYRSLWAIFAYLILGIGAVYALIQWRVRRLKAKNLELEAIIADRTHQIRAQNEQLEIQTQQLKELDKEKARFFTNISHEFRTPLSVISGVLELIPEAEKEKKLIRRNTQNLLNLVNQILDLRKLESGKLSLDLIQDDIVAYLKYISESFQSLAEKKEIELEFMADPASIMMDYDEKKMLRIISNLLSNAIKFSPEGGVIGIKCTVGGNDSRLILTISDNGIGIPEDKLPYIFNHFYQVDSSSTRKEEGTGIGLTLVAELVKLMEGEVNVKSELGKGTTFTLSFPISRQAPLPKEGPAELHPEQLSGLSLASSQVVEGHTQVNEALPSLLIVEDNPDVRQYLVACLQDSYNLSLAYDGQEGMEMAILQVPDIIVSDVMMPRKDGFELCNTLKLDERTSHIPIILLTARADDESRITGLERGADAYLAKPFNQTELLVRLRKLLELRQRLQARYTSGKPLQPSDDPATRQEDDFITRLREAIEAHLDEAEYGTQELCAHLGVSRTQLYNKLKALTGRSIAVYIRFIRLQKAKEMLESTDQTVAEIAYLTGFNDPNYFSRVFSKEFGAPPGSLRA